MQFRTISRREQQFAITMTFGQSLMMRGKVYLIKFKENWSNPSAGKLVETRKRLCSLSILKAFKTLIQPKKKGTIRVKKSGIKLHIGVDISGLPHAVMVTTADVTDRNGAIEMTEYYRDFTMNLDSVLKYLVDGGYTGEPFAESIKLLVGAEVEVAKHNSDSRSCRRLCVFS